MDRTTAHYRLDLLGIPAAGRGDLLRVLTAGPSRPGDDDLLAQYDALEGERQVGAQWVADMEARDRIRNAIAFVLVIVGLIVAASAAMALPVLFSQ